jgi:HK97 gp10 family phage protein
MKVEVKLTGVDGVLATLKSLPAEIVSKRGGPVKLALAKGARLIRDEAKKNLRRVIAMNGDESTGLLEKNVISSRGKPPSTGKGERYLVRVRRKTYPGRKPEKDGKVPTTRKTAQLLEYGSPHQPATPWLRPAVQQHAEAAITTITQDLNKRIAKTVADMAAKNRGK